MVVQVAGQAGAGAAADVETDVESVRAECAPQNALRVAGAQRQLGEHIVIDFFIEARDTLLDFLPAYPRHVKRVLNRLRVLLWVAYRRELFEKTELTAPMLGNWVALQARWPEVANAIMRRPQAHQFPSRCPIGPHLAILATLTGLSHSRSVMLFPCMNSSK